MMKKADFILIAAILASAAVFFFIFNNGGEKGGVLRAAVYIDGELYGTYICGGDEKVIEIRTARGYNKMVIYPDGAAVTEADCPGKDCVRTGKISGVNKNIVCLPHRLLICVENGGMSDLDAVAK